MPLWMVDVSGLGLQIVGTFLIHFHELYIIYNYEYNQCNRIKLIITAGLKLELNKLSKDQSHPKPGLNHDKT